MADIPCRTGAPEPEGTVVAFPDWVMLDRMGRTIDHDDHAAAQKAVKKDSTGAVLVHTASGHWGYFSFTLADPPKPSYLDLHWRKGPEACPYVLAADEDLLLLGITISELPYYDDTPDDLFVYTAADPASPSLLRLPACTKSARGLARRTTFLQDNLSIGILRLADCRYLVADLIVSPAATKGGNSRRRNDDDKNGNDPIMIAKLCVYSSKKGKWRVFTKTAPQPQDQSQFPTLWSTDTVLPFDGRFLCWVDYFSGVLLCDLSNTSSPVLHFVPFPGNKHYSDNVRVSRNFPDRFRSVSVVQGMIRFVHIDNDCHERACMDDDWDYYETEYDDCCRDETDDDDCRDEIDQVQDAQPDQKSVPKITIWTLNMMDGNFKWEVHREINLDLVWSQQDWGIPQRLPEFPIFTVDDPDVLCCLLREKEFYGKPWMIMVDMKYAKLRSCTPYVNEQLSYIVDMYAEARRNSFSDIPLLPTVFSKYLKRRPTGILVDTDKFAAHSSKRCKFSM